MSPNRQQNWLKTDHTPSESPAWMLVGCFHTQAGQLRLKGGRLDFADIAGEIHFSVPLADLEAVWSPWYYFGGGMKLKAHGTTHRLTFVLPNDQSHPLGGWRKTYESTLRDVRLTLMVKLVPEFFFGRLLTRRWLELLVPEPINSVNKPRIAK